MVFCTTYSIALCCSLYSAATRKHTMVEKNILRGWGDKRAFGGQKIYQV